MAARKRFAPVGAYLVIYLGFLWLLHAREGLSVAEPLMILAIIGGGFTLAAWLLCLRVPARDWLVREPRTESLAMVALWFAVTMFVTWGLPSLRAAGGVAGEASVLAGKLAVFVFVPVALFGWLWRYRPGELLQWPPDYRGQWLPLLGVSVLLVAFQLVAGRAPRDLAALDPSLAQVALVLPVAALWLVLEVGLVEEFFFRALLQSRLAAWTRSPATAIVITALLFGLMHSPGLYLRPEITGEAVGAAPSLLHAVGYSVLITSTTGFFLGVLWHRTRNLWLLAIVHAVNDLVPGLDDFIRLFTGQ